MKKEQSLAQETGLRISSENKEWETSSQLGGWLSVDLYEFILNFTLCLLSPVTTGGNPKYSKTEETFSKVGAGHGFFTNKVHWGLFAFIFASLKEQ